MGQTMAEKIFSAKVGRKVSAGEYVTAPLDRVMGHEAISSSAARLASAGIERIWDPSKVVIILDHFVPASNDRLLSFNS